MKHPALTRAMAFTLAIVSIIVLLVGSSGLKKAEELKAEDTAAHDKYVERVELYKTLTAELEGLEAYNTADETLTEKETQHDKDAAQHRTDVATHTATEGGYKTGADALWEAKAQLEEKSWGYYGGMQTYNEKKAEFEKLKAAAQGMTALSAACTMASAQAAATVPVPAPGDAPTEPVAPVAPTAPTEPPMPAVPVSPTPPAAPVAPTAPDRAAYDSDEAYAAALAAYEAALAAYPAQLEAYAAALALYEEKSAAYQQELLAYTELKTAYDAAMLVYLAEKAAYDDAMLTYNAALAAYESAKAQYEADKAAWDSADAAYQAYARKVAGWSALMQQGAGIMSAMGMEAPSTTPDAAGLAAFTVSGLDMAAESCGMGSPVLLVALGMTTGIGGGMLRDVLTNAMPVVLRKRIYAVASLSGALLYYLMLYFGANKMFSAVISMLFIFALRMLATKYKWNLPRADL